MKKLILWMMCLVVTGNLFSQEYITPEHPEYDARKAAGTLTPRPPGFYKVKQQGSKQTIQPLDLPSDVIINQKRERGGGDPVDCNCFQTLDSTYSIAPFTNGTAPEYRNDDGSTEAIDIPFEFCLYGDSYNSLFINNNGNISFGEPVGAFSSEAFPNSSLMVAPFWADVDTRNATSGVVYYKITQHYLVVIWDNVGYYSSMADKKNSFQLIITDGTVPIVPFGFNVGFCFGDMQWTTGSASGGVNGFGGTAATTGANQGNNINYVQFGQFDHAGADYDGPFAEPDGVSWLDNKTFFFNTCTETASSNVTPVPIQSDICAPVNLCVGQSVPFNITFFAVEPEQSCSTLVTTAATDGLEITNNEAGNFNVISGTFTATAENVGMNEVIFTCTDDGVPAGVTQISAFFNVVANNFTVPILGNDSICQGSCTELSPGIFDTYIWSTGEETAFLQVCAPGGPYTVDLTVGECIGTSLPFTVYEAIPQIPVITGPDSACVGAIVTISTTPDFASYEWEGVPDAQFNSADVTIGTYTLTTIDLHGCSAQATYTVAPAQGITPVITAEEDSVCAGQTVVLTSSGGFNTYSWFGDGSGSTQSINVGPGTFILETVDPSGCANRDTFTVIPFLAFQPVIVGDHHYCFNELTTLSTSESFVSYTWSPGGATTDSIDAAVGNYTVVAIDSNGCETAPSAPFNVASSSPEAEILGIETFCQFDSLILTAPGGPDFFQTYRWITLGDTLSTNDSLTYYGEPLLTLQVTDAFGCLDTFTTVIDYIDQPTANFVATPGSPSVMINTPITYTSTSVAGEGDILNSWMWTFNPPDDTVHVESPVYTWESPDTGQKVITLYVTSGFGCKDTISSAVYIIDKPFVPNVFSPDGDGFNETLKIPFLIGYPGNTLSIYNRWGKMVFEGSDYKDDWNGDNLPSGTYFYVVSAPGLEPPLKGSVTLIRN